jgi:signal transduction protein with GAF and PtsI domain
MFPNGNTVIDRYSSLFATHKANSVLFFLQSPVRIAVGQGIAGFVAKTGEIVNIKDAYKHPKFFKEIDLSTGFHTR